MMGAKNGNLFGLVLSRFAPFWLVLSQFDLVLSGFGLI